MKKETCLALRLAFIYASFGILWITLSDKFLSSVISDTTTLTQFQTYKGSFYVVITAVLVFYLMLGALKQQSLIEEKLLASEERWKFALEGSGDGVWDWNPITDQALFSKRWEEMIGYSEHEFPSTGSAWVAHLHSDDKEHILSSMQNYFAGNQSIYNVEFRMRCKEGSWKWILSRGMLVSRDAEGNPLRMIGTHTDITERKKAETERKKAEKEILRLNIELEQRVVERTAELTAANHELESFAYAVSHDLRAPLRAMSGFSGALTEDYGSLLQGNAIVYLDQINQASKKMGELIDGILALSRSTQGELQRDSVNISELAIRLFEEFAHGEPERNVEWQVEPNLSATGDPRMIEVVLCNLLGNAWKYTSKTAKPLIHVYSGEIGGLTGICVADNGVGFDMAHIMRLFKPFQRLHRQDEFPGLGIGLATVQRIINRHGGKIRAEGRPDLGSTFCFNFAKPVGE